MTGPASRFRCAGCGATPDEGAAPPFRCPNAGGDDVDHVLERELGFGDPGGGGGDGGGGGRAATASPATPGDRPDEANPFLRYGERLHARHFARERGLSDEAIDAVYAGLDARVAEIDGRGFATTPFEPAPGLADALGMAPRGSIRVKDETGNVTGTHKARHLYGVMAYLGIRRRLGLPAGGGAETGAGAPEDASPTLAIASCGNAALAAAVVARAGGSPLDVFVPEAADAAIVARLRDLGARVEICRREPGVPGDPAMRRFRARVAGGAVPFSVQGPDNGLAVEGGRTIAWEMATALAAAGEPLDRVFVPVGGGALASALIAGLRDAVSLGELPGLPHVHVVQTTGCHPLERAHRLVVRRMTARDEPAAVVLPYAATHRSEFMRPWETPPTSLADAILDDEAYDWLAVVRGMLESGGGPVVVDEAGIRRANDLARSATGATPSFTGSASLAGLLALREAGEIGDDERIAVLFTGIG